MNANELKEISEQAKLQNILDAAILEAKKGFNRLNLYIDDIGGGDGWGDSCKRYKKFVYDDTVLKQLKDNGFTILEVPDPYFIELGWLGRLFDCSPRTKEVFHAILW